MEKKALLAGKKTRMFYTWENNRHSRYVSCHAIFFTLKGAFVKLYLDNCCFNRPFDDQSNMRNRLEADAKIYIQSRIRIGDHELIWSYILEYENSVNPHEDRRANTLIWKGFATEHCNETNSVKSRAANLKALGIRTKDALHISCAIESKADYLITTDDRLLNKNVAGIKIINPIDFLRKKVSHDI
jgi:predicted nucleic acid-binding protein